MGRYKDAMTRIDKQITDDEDDHDGDDDGRVEKLARMCKKAKSLARDTCEVPTRALIHDI